MSHIFYYWTAFILANTAALLSVFWNSALISPLTSLAVKSVAKEPLPSPHLSAKSCRLASNAAIVWIYLHQCGTYVVMSCIGLSAVSWNISGPVLDMMDRMEWRWLASSDEIS